MVKGMKIPNWIWFVVALGIILVAGICGNKSDTENNYDPQERWNVMILVDASGSLKRLDNDNSNLDINDTLTYVIRRFKTVLEENGSKVKCGIQPFDIGINDEAILQFGFIDSDTEEKIQIPYDKDHRGTDIEKALNYALGEMKKEQDHDELMRNIIIIFTDGYEDKVERSESLEEALKDERELADELNCELFVISPNTDDNIFEVEGDINNIEGLAEDFQFGRMYFYNSCADCELENYIVTKDGSLIMKMLELVAQIVSGKEIEMIDKKSAYSQSQGKVVSCYEFDVENPDDTIELYFQNLDMDDVRKIKVFRVDDDDEKEIFYRVEDPIEDNAILIQLSNVREGRYRIKTKDWPRKIVEYDESAKTELTKKLLEYEEEYAKKIICLRKSNLTYNIRSELIQNNADPKGERRWGDGREFNVPYLEKIVVVPVIDGRKVQDEKVLHAFEKNFPHFYVEAPDNQNLWEYRIKHVDKNVRGISLSYDEKEKGFVGFVPVMIDGPYRVTICMTRGNKTDIIDYPFECKTGILQTIDGQRSWKYDEGFSIHLMEMGDFLSVGQKLWGRDITLDNGNGFFEGDAVECQANIIDIKKTNWRRYLPYWGRYEVHGRDQFNDKWSISGTVLVLSLRITVYAVALISVVFLSCWIFVLKWNTTYRIENADTNEILAKNVEVPLGKYLTMYVLVEHAIALGKIKNYERERVEKIVEENKEVLQKEMFIRKGICKSKRRYEEKRSRNDNWKIGSMRIQMHKCKK